MKSFKIAICFSGQARYWKAASKNIKEFFKYNGNHPILGIPIEVDFFIHTWDTNTWRYPKTTHIKFYNEKHNDGDEIIETYSPKEFEQEEWNETKFVSPWEPMFYSFNKSLMMKREYELNNNFQYDLVVKARLDIIYNPNNNFNTFFTSPGVCYTCQPIRKFPSEFNYNSFDDVIFYGDSPTMDLVGDLYHSYLILHSNKILNDREYNDLNLLPTIYYGPGTLLYSHLINLGIHPDVGTHIEYVVVRSTSIEEDTDSIRDYEKIKQKYIEWYV